MCRPLCRTRKSTPVRASRSNAWWCAATTKRSWSTLTSSRSRSPMRCYGSIRSTRDDTKYRQVAIRRCFSITCLSSSPRTRGPIFQRPVFMGPRFRGDDNNGAWYEALQKLFRNFSPLLAAAIEQRLFAVLRQVGSIAPTKSPDALAASPERLVPETQERAFDRPHVFSSKPPIVRSQPAQIEQPISGDASGEVDVRVEIAHGERTQRTKDRLSPVQARITRARHRTPAAALAINKDDVVQVVDRHKAHHHRRIAVLLEDTGGRQRGLEAMRPPAAQNLPKASERFGIRRSLSIIRQAVEKSLH